MRSRLATAFAFIAFAPVGLAILLGFPAMTGQEVPWAWIGGLLCVAAVGMVLFALVDSPSWRQEAPDASSAPTTTGAGQGIFADGGAETREEDLSVDQGVWRELWATAQSSDVSVPPYGVRPYWIPAADGSWAPVAMLAYKGAAVRLRAAESDRIDPSSLAILLNDPDARVRAAATANLARR